MNKRKRTARGIWGVCHGYRSGTERGARRKGGERSRPAITRAVGTETRAKMMGTDLPVLRHYAFGEEGRVAGPAWEPAWGSDLLKVCLSQ